MRCVSKSLTRGVSLAVLVLALSGSAYAAREPGSKLPNPRTPLVRLFQAILQACGDGVIVPIP